MLLGLQYQEGKGRPRDDGRALKLFVEGCEKGNGVSCYEAGRMTGMGRGVPADVEKAKQYAKRACELGDGRGCSTLKRLEQLTK